MKKNHAFDFHKQTACTSFIPERAIVGTFLLPKMQLSLDRFWKENTTSYKRFLKENNIS